MGKVTRNRHTAELKARVALEAIWGEQTLAEFGAKHGIHLTPVDHSWCPSSANKGEGGPLIRQQQRQPCAENPYWLPWSSANRRIRASCVTSGHASSMAVAISSRSPGSRCSRRCNW